MAAKVTSEKEIEPLNSINTDEKDYQSVLDLELASSKFALQSDNGQEITLPVIQEKDENVLESVKPLVN